ncbi:unnamed protein product [Rhizoctonia solani]|uniref:Uncharacterized protein n=1 Tax=Rhizoctonia solani TaxID=456999 RepID=A0A8H3DGI5_9AGAM|nr:unnamed protein product [Rhizoctonia solani]
MSHEARNDIPSDLRQECLLSLADAVDALAKAAATVAAVARTTAHRFSMDAPVSPGIQVNQGINRGKAPDNFYKPISDQTGGVNKGPHLDVADDEDDHPSSGLSALLPIGIGASKQDWRTSNTVSQPYRLLVDSEADVLLFVCALIDKYQRVICYLPCSPGPLTTYKRLVESVTQSPVHILNSTASSKLDQASANFLENEGAVLLVPETLSPKIEIAGDNSWVIHAGWPVSEAQYITQRKSHKAQNNILVAYTGDRSLYPSGNNIVEQTEPWPKDGASFRASISILRPLYEATLSELPFEMKKRVYSDWLQFRGLHGPRRVEAWTASTMVQRANAYLMDVWRWSGSNAGDNPTPFPAVSTRFVAHNGLQSAVQDGFLRVEDDDTDSHQPAPTPLPRLEPSPTQIDFLSTTGHTYFALSEEFDAIPLMCFIASKYDKVICFLEGQGSLRHYQKLLGKIMGRSVFYPTALSNDHATEEAVLQFISATTPAVLLLACNTANLPSILNERSIDCCIYWGFGIPLKPGIDHLTLRNDDLSDPPCDSHQLQGTGI